MYESLSEQIERFSEAIENLRPGHMLIVESREEDGERTLEIQEVEEPTLDDTGF